eukprot:CAMPEP_0170058004 /NCGR_PEP_ID=MMETSP0019_2-20121128/787_1 /TAXON_ID=98059 /ORGANISM="Dinobryon sp., Strain UTEXLB2267" /LENGTH=1211 /DNA_ID=CAMNT_0010262831 /DNA_START=1869 /DNA_END=5504 /DNA_ORIENTATION=-
MMRPSAEEKGSGGMTGRCPFSSASSNSLCPYPAPPVNSAFFSPQQLQDLFPFHLVVDNNFTVIQEGNKLSPYLQGISAMGTHIGNVFQLKFPKCEWNWADIILNIDSSFEMRLANTTFVTDILTAQSKGKLLAGDRSNNAGDPQKRSVPNSTRPSADINISAADITYRRVQHLTLKGGIYISDPSLDPTLSHFCAFFLVSPKVHNMTEMLQHNVSLPDFPRHSCQRDFAILGDHLMSETRIALKLDVMNKKLDKDLVGALQDSEAEKLVAKARADRLEQLPVHLAVIEKMPEEVVLERIGQYPETLLERDYDGKTAFEHCLESEGYYEAVLKIVRDRLPFDPVTKLPVPSEKHGFVWTKVVQSFKYAKIVKSAIDEFIHISHELAHAKDDEGRPAVYIASPLCQRHIKESLYFYRRYEIAAIDVPHHKSATCTLHIAIDHGNNDQRVALKFMAVKDQYLIEQEIRRLGDFHEDYVISILRCHDGEIDPAFHQEVVRRGLQKYPYCIVMPAAERNLQTIISAERIAGRDWAQIKTIGNQVAEALQHMHQKGVLHGDVKPLNIMRCDGRVKLIDLDASASTLTGYSGGKSSSAYVPPCLLHHTGKEILIRICPLDPVTKKPITVGLPYEVVPAAYPHDSWALGAVLYELCAGIKLFLQDDEDNIDPESMQDLYNFTDDFKQKKLAKIADPQARNLVSQLLSRDPRKRPNFHQVLAHPFLSGKKASRMIGDTAEFDVFLSYRVNSDLETAAFLYETLTQKGLKVWWDKTCLLPGVPWEVGFTDGLLKSRIFLPIFSRGAINSPTERSQNFNVLGADSECDSLLLEMRLALELQTRDLVEKIYPVFIGDRLLECDSPGSLSSSLSSVATVSSEAVYGHYFKDGCHPKINNDDVVASVEKQLRLHLERLCLGSPLLEEMTIAAVVKAIVKNQGHVVDGMLGPAYLKVQQDILKMQTQQLQMHQKEQEQLRQQQEQEMRQKPPPPPPKQMMMQQQQQLNDKVSMSNKLPTREAFTAAVMSSVDSSSDSVSLKSGLKGSVLSPLPSKYANVKVSIDDARINEMASYLHECGLTRGKSKQYAQKLVLVNNVDSPKTLLKIYDNLRLMNILNNVMDRQDAEAVSREIFKLRKNERGGRYRTPERSSNSNNGNLPSLGRREFLSQIESVPSQLPSLANVAPLSGHSHSPAVGLMSSESDKQAANRLQRRAARGMRRNTTDD